MSKIWRPAPSKVKITKKLSISLGHSASPKKTQKNLEPNLEHPTRRRVFAKTSGMICKLIFIHTTFQKGFSLKPLSISTKYNQPIYYEDAPVSCRLCLMMGGGVLIKICSKAVRSHLHFWWSWWWWWQWWQWWRTLSHIDAQKPIYGIKCLWEFGCTP